MVAAACGKIVRTYPPAKNNKEYEEENFEIHVVGVASTFRHIPTTMEC